MTPGILSSLTLSPTQWTTEALMTTEPSPRAPHVPSTCHILTPLSLIADPWGRIHFAHFMTRKLPHREVTCTAILTCEWWSWDSNIKATSPCPSPLSHRLSGGAQRGCRGGRNTTVWLFFFSEELFKWKLPRKRSAHCHPGPSTMLGTEWALDKLKQSKWKDV